MAQCTGIRFFITTTKYDEVKKKKRNSFRVVWEGYDCRVAHTPARIARKTCAHW